MLVMCDVELMWGTVESSYATLYVGQRWPFVCVWGVTLRADGDVRQPRRSFHFWAGDKRQEG